jgi:predicted CopG family antitoxin
MAKTTIQVDDEIVKILNKRKIHPRESNNEVIKRVLDGSD